MAEMNNNPYLVGKKKKIKIDAFTVINYTFLTAFAILCILPCLYVLLASFADKIIRINWSEPMQIDEAIELEDSLQPGLYYIRSVDGVAGSEPGG